MGRGFNSLQRLSFRAPRQPPCRPFVASGPPLVSRHASCPSASLRSRPGCLLTTAAVYFPPASRPQAALRDMFPGECRSGQSGQTVNLLTYVFGGSNPSSPTSAFRVVSQESASSRTTSPPIRRACVFVDGLRLRRSQSAPESAPHVSERRTQPPRPTGAGANGCGLRREGEVERFIWVETTGSVPMPPAARESLRFGHAFHPTPAVVP